MSIVGIILGAGYGTRLQQGLEKDPLQIFKEDIGKTKPLLYVGGLTVADHWIEQFYTCKHIGPIIVVTNDYYKLQFEDWLNNIKNNNKHLWDNIFLISDGSTSNNTRLGAIHAINIAWKYGQDICKTKKHYKNMKGACIVAGDTLLHFKHIYKTKDSFDLNNFITNLYNNNFKYDSLIAYNLKDKNETLKRGILEIDSENRVINFLEKPDPSATKSRLACPPFYALTLNTLKEIDVFFKELSSKPIEKKDSPGTFIQWLITKRKFTGNLQRKPIFVSLISGRFDIGNIEQYKHALSIFGLTKYAMECFTPPIVSIGRSYARIGLMGNPSDGYHGKTLSFTIEDFYCEVIIRSNSSSFISFHESCSYSSFETLCNRVRSEGYCGGLRLLKATTARFFDLCKENNNLPPKSSERLDCCGFDMYFKTSIPLQVGLAGSSAIVCATFRCLSSYFQIPLHILSPMELWPQHILDVEVKELGIAAGLQDRVCQFYEGLIYMDFNQQNMNEFGHGIYESLDISCLNKISLYIAHLIDKPSESGKVHSNLRERWHLKDSRVIDAMDEFARLTQQTKDLLLNNDILDPLILEQFCDLIDKNFDLRVKIMGKNVIGEENITMVKIARSLNLAGKFCGSGGAIICVPRPNSTAKYKEIAEEFTKHKIHFCKITIAEQSYPFQNKYLKQNF